MALWGKIDNEASKPKYLSDTLRNEQDVSDKDATVGVDVAEAQAALNKAKGIKTPGWTEYRTYTDAQGNVRHKAEVLVAFGGNFTSGDADLLPPVSGTISGTAEGPLNAGVIAGTALYNDGSTGAIAGTADISAETFTGTFTGTVEFKGVEYDFTGTIEQTFADPEDLLTWTGGTFEGTTESIPGVGVLTVTGTQVAVDINTGASTFTGTISN